MFCRRCNSTYYDGFPGFDPDHPQANPTRCKICGLTEYDGLRGNAIGACEICETVFLKSDDTVTADGPTCKMCPHKTTEPVAPPKRKRGRPRKHPVPA